MRQDVLKLINVWADGHDDVLVASAECDGSGSDLCEHLGVHAYPSIKDGASVEQLRDYHGGHDFESMNAAVQSLSPSPGPSPGPAPGPSPGPAPSPGKHCRWNSDCPPGEECFYLSRDATSGICSDTPPGTVMV